MGIGVRKSLAGLLILTGFLWTGCSKTSRSMRSLKRAEKMLQQANAFMASGQGQKAEPAYQSSVAAASQARSLVEETSPLSRKAGEIEATASKRAQSLKSPDGAVLAIFEPLSQGNVEEFLLFSDIQETAHRGLGEERWASLSSEEQQKLIEIANQMFGWWVTGYADYFRVMNGTIKETTLSGSEAAVNTEWKTVGAEAEVLFRCIQRPGGWKVFDFEVPAVGLGMMRYLQQFFEKALEEVPSIQAMVARPDALEFCKKKFQEVLDQEPELEDSLVGQLVTLQKDPSKPYVVMQQTRKGEDFWLLVYPQGEDVSKAEWVIQSETSPFNEEEALWQSP